MATTFIYLDNYRGFSDSLIPLRRVNWLVGENSTGKSSFLDLLYDLSYPPFWFWEPRLGMRERHTRHFHDMVSAASKTKRSFTIGAFSLGANDSSNDYGMIVTYSNLDGRAVPEKITIIHEGSRRTIAGKLWARKEVVFHERNKKCEARTSDSPSSLWAGAKKHISIHKSAAGLQSAHISEDKYGVPLLERFSELLFDGASVEDRAIKVPFPFDGSFVELAPIRTKPRRTYDAPQTEFSPEGEHTPYVIRKHLSNKSQAEEFKKFLESAGQESGLFKAIRIKEYGRGARDPFEVQIVLGKTPLGLENVGYGVSQSLPILVEMFVRAKKTVFLIQQPEVHLHPKAQASIGDIVADLSRKEEKRFFIETHSDFAIDRFRLNIRKNGPIPSQLLYFSRTETGNKATSIPIDKDGNLSADQPDGYRDFFYNEGLAMLG